MLNSPDQTAETNQRSVTDCLTALIRSGEDAQMMLEPIRSFCRFAGYDEDGLHQGVCDENSTFAALNKHVDALQLLFDLWNEPTFPALVPEALMHLRAIFDVVDNAIFKEHVGRWNIAWYGLYNAVASKKASSAPLPQESAISSANSILRTRSYQGGSVRMSGHDLCRPRMHRTVRNTTR